MMDIKELLDTPREILIENSKNWYAKRISEELEIPYSEAIESFEKYYYTFPKASLEEALVISEELTSWILSKQPQTSRNEWDLYSCFKWHFPYIDSRIYDQCIFIFTNKLGL